MLETDRSPSRLSARTAVLSALVATITAILAGLVSGAVPVRAESLVYIDATRNIATSRPDGSLARRVTTGATQEAAPKAISVEDDGGIVSFLRLPGGDPFLWVHRQDGTVQRGPFLFDMPMCSVSPVRSAVTPDGVFVAATYIRGNGCMPTGGSELQTKLVSATGPTMGDIYGYHSGLTEPRWLRHPDMRLAGLEGDVIRVWSSPDEPVLQDWLTLDDTLSWDIDSFDVHPAANRMIIEQSPQGTPDGGERRDILLLSYTGPPGPTSVPTPICTLDGLVANSELRARPRFSPDGTRIAWNGPDGIYVSPAPVAGPGGVCTVSPKLVVPGGSEVEWSRLDLNAGTGPGSKVQIEAIRGADRAGFRKGLTLDLDAPAAGLIKAKATVSKPVAKRLGLSRRPRGPVVVAKGSARAGSAGAVKLKLKPTKKAKRVWKKMGGVTLRVEVTQGGSTSTRSIKLRRRSR